MADLVAWLLQQLDEDMRIALAASPGPWRLNAEQDEVLAVDDIPVTEPFALSNRQLRSTAVHIARHDPAFVLREVEAKRRILDDHLPLDSIDCMTCDIRSMSGTWPCDTVKFLALPYADHPDYREEWRP